MRRCKVRRYINLPIGPREDGTLLKFPRVRVRNATSTGTFKVTPEDVIKAKAKAGFSLGCVVSNAGDNGTAKGFKHDVLDFVVIKTRLYIIDRVDPITKMPSSCVRYETPVTLRDLVDANDNGTHSLGQYVRHHPEVFLITHEAGLPPRSQRYRSMQQRTKAASVKHSKSHIGGNRRIVVAKLAGVLEAALRTRRETRK